MATTRPLRRLFAALVLAVLASPSFAQTETASEFYLTYRAAFDKATKIEDVMPFMSKTTLARIEATPAEDRPKMFGLIKIMGTITDVKIVNEVKTAAGATLTVDALDPAKTKITGTVNIVRENGAWKLATESWTSS